MNAAQRRRQRRKVRRVVEWNKRWAEENLDPWMDEPWTPEELACFDLDEEPEPW